MANGFLSGSIKGPQRMCYQSVLSHAYVPVSEDDQGILGLNIARIAP